MSDVLLLDFGSTGPYHANGLAEGVHWCGRLGSGTGHRLLRDQRELLGVEQATEYFPPGRLRERRARPLRAAH